MKRKIDCWLDLPEAHILHLDRQYDIKIGLSFDFFFSFENEFSYPS